LQGEPIPPEADCKSEIGAPRKPELHQSSASFLYFAEFIFRGVPHVNSGELLKKTIFEKLDTEKTGISRLPESQFSMLFDSPQELAPPIMNPPKVFFQEDHNKYFERYVK